MGSESRLKIVLDMIDNTQGELKRLQQDLEGVKTSSSDAKNPLTALKDNVGAMQGEILAATGVLAGFGLTMKAAFDMGEQGAAFVQTRESFNGLMDRVGASREQLNLLRSGAKGTIDDLSLMRAESALLAGAQGDLARSLASASPQLMEIAKAANKLNPTLGDTNFMFESLALGVKRNSPMILDNLGLTIKIEEANKKYAESLGKAVDQLSAEEQKQALLNDVLRAGNVLIKQAGGNTDSATDSFQRLNASLTNVGNSGKEKLMPFLANAALGLEVLLTWNDRVNAALAEQTTRVTQSSQTYGEYITKVSDAALAAGKLTETDRYWLGQLAEGKPVLVSYTAGVDGLLQKYNFLTAAQYESIRGYDMEATRLQNMSQLHKSAASAAQEQANAQSALKSEMALLQVVIAGPLRQAQDDYSTKVHDIRVKQEALSKEIQTATLIYGENSPKVIEMKNRYSDLGLQLDGVNEKFSKNVDQLIFMAAQSAITSDGIQAGEVPALMALAETLGLADKGTADLYTSFEKLAASNTNNGIPAATGMNDLAEKWHQTLVERSIPSTDTSTQAFGRLKDKQLEAATAADGLTKSINAIPKVTDVYINTFHRHYVENYSYSTVIPDAGKSTTNNGDTQIVDVQERDSGGPAEAGQAYLIGRGAQPEMFIPKSDGYFVPNADKLSGGAINTTNIYLTANYANAQSEASLRDDVALLQMMTA